MRADRGSRNSDVEHSGVRSDTLPADALSIVPVICGGRQHQASRIAAITRLRIRPGGGFGIEGASGSKGKRGLRRRV